MKTLNFHQKTAQLIFLGGLLWSVTFMGCNDAVENPAPPNEDELITSVTLTFAPIQGGSDTVSASWRDLDGPGGNPPGQTDNIVLEKSSFYSMMVEFLNESKSPPGNITIEIQAEADEHQVFFTGPLIESGLVQHQYNDLDVNGNPVGLINQITTQTAGSGLFTITLKHQPEIKSGSTGINDGDTDVEVNFELIIQ